MRRILFSFQKAFDKAPRKRLLKKLSHLGVRGKVLEMETARGGNSSQK